VIVKPVDKHRFGVFTNTMCYFKMPLRNKIFHSILPWAWFQQFMAIVAKFY